MCVTFTGQTLAITSKAAPESWSCPGWRGDFLADMVSLKGFPHKKTLKLPLQLVISMPKPLKDARLKALMVPEEIGHLAFGCRFWRKSHCHTHKYLNYEVACMCNPEREFWDLPWKTVPETFSFRCCSCEVARYWSWKMPWRLNMASSTSVICCMKEGGGRVDGPKVSVVCWSPWISNYIKPKAARSQIYIYKIPHQPCKNEILCIRAFRATTTVLPLLWELL